MSGVDQQRLREVFEAVMDAPPSDRAAVIESKCGGDVRLRAEIESLLVHHDATVSLLADRNAGIGRAAARNMEMDARAREDSDGQASVKAGRVVPERIGAYRILRLLGAGGMGIVYLAEQDDPRRRVAVKVMRGEIPSPELLRRFKRESQVLGKLQHPGIAHIYDAGTAAFDGVERAYFAMEYIDGVPLTEYANQGAISTRGRLELVAQVCDSIQHAHERGVIHRDLKPGNILVDGTGRPRVLDFGVARAVNAEMATLTVQTDAGQLIGTLQYMSPEQIGPTGVAIDARSDVYALGVVAFELVAGIPPYHVRDQTLAQVARTIQEVEPTRLGSVDSKFRGDIETMLAKALEKDRERRYSSAAEFAADIRRHLDDQPIVARPATTWYRLRKFARRNMALVAGVAVAFIALAVGFVFTLILYLQAREARALADAQREIAMRESQIAKTTNQFLIEDMLAAPNPWNAGGRTMTVASVLDRAAERIEKRFAQLPLVEAAVRRALGESYDALGLHREAQPQLDRSLALERGSSTPDIERLALTLGAVGRNLWNQSRFDEAEEAARAALDEARRASGPDSPLTGHAQQLLGDVQIGQSRYKKAAETMREAVRVFRLHGEEQAVPLAHAINTLGSTFFYDSDYEQAEKLKLEALATFRERLGERHPYAAEVLNDLANAYLQKERYSEAERSFRDALPLLAEALGKEHAITLTCERSLATTLSYLGRNAEAEPLLRRNITAAEQALGADHNNTMAAINCLATLYLRADRSEEAAPLLRLLLERSERSLGPEHAETLKYAHNLAWAEINVGDMTNAEEHFRRALDGFSRTLGETHHDTREALDSLAQLLEKQQRTAEAADFLKRLIDACRAADVPEDMELALFFNRYGTCLASMEQYAASREPFTRSIEICSKFVDANDWRMAIVVGRLGNTLSHLGEHKEAEARLLASLETFRTNKETPHGAVQGALKRLAGHYERTGEAEKAAKVKQELESSSGRRE